MLGCRHEQVTRTGKGQQIPVYTDFKNGRTRVLTLVRKVTGDKKVCLESSATPQAAGHVLPCAKSWPTHSLSRSVQALCDELHKVCDGATVSMKQGRIEIEGNYCLPVTAYLAGLGF